MKKKILVVGSANMDLVSHISRIPERGETTVETKKYYGYVPGGKGANAAVAAARAGAETVFCTRLGDDLNGSVLRRLYDTEAIDGRFISTSMKSPTGLALIMLESGGANRIIVYPGANLELSREDVEAAMTCYPDALLLSLEIDPEIAIYASQLAVVKDIPVFVDGGPADKGFPIERFPHLAVFSPNETETEIYTGIMPNNPDNCLRAVLELSHKIDADYFVLKLGDRGCYVYDGKYYHCVPSFDVDVVDTTAAGDTFTAALTLNYLECGDMQKAAEFANAAGAIAVSRRGSGTAAPTKEEIEAFLSERTV